MKRYITLVMIHSMEFDAKNKKDAKKEAMKLIKSDLKKDGVIKIKEVKE